MYERDRLRTQLFNIYCIFCRDLHAFTVQCMAMQLMNEESRIERKKSLQLFLREIFSVKSKVLIGHDSLKTIA